MADKYEDLRIYKTKDFDKFTFLTSNRKVAIPHVKNLRKKIEEHGFDKTTPIKVIKSKGGFAITAGQHRFTACKGVNEEDEGLEFFYTIIPNKDVDLSIMSDHHGGFKDWNDSERLHRFVVSKNLNYVRMHDLIRTYPEFMNVQNALMMFYGLHPESGHPLARNAKKLFIDGDLKVSNRKLKEAMEQAETISQIIERREADHSRHAKKTSFIRALYLIINNPKFDSRKFARAMDKSETGLLSQSNWQETLEHMLLIYNGSTRSKRLEFKKVMDSLTKTRQRQKYGKV